MYLSHNILQTKDISQDNAINSIGMNQTGPTNLLVNRVYFDSLDHDMHKAVHKYSAYVALVTGNRVKK